MTYSIVAHDPNTGEFGVAVQSHWFAVGGTVAWAWPGVGAVATQATALAGHGPGTLELMRGGMTAQQALAARLKDDALAASRQLAAVDASGGVAVHTGEQCMADAGHATGRGVSCQANIMRNGEVWHAMLASYERSAEAPLAQRLMGALEAGEEAGGDLRGRQSAALLVVPADGQWWETTISLRVEDHPEPLVELRRLLELEEAYRLCGEADELIMSADAGQASRLYGRARELAPDNHELLFWAGLSVAAAGDLEGGLEQVREAIAMHGEWADFLRRSGPQISPVAAVLIERLGLS